MRHRNEPFMGDVCTDMAHLHEKSKGGVAFIELEMEPTGWECFFSFLL